ncbi:MAG TPA: branched-chain amino acid ABC transporter permease [Acidimicrobiia bacterium]|jgi:branched-chain amino acid transport system permease protein
MDWVGIFLGGLLAMIGPVTAAYAISASGLNLQFGYAGLLNFGHVAFMLAGAYGLAITVESGGSMWLGIVVGILAAVVLGLLMGIPTLRLRADFFAITSIAVAEVIRLLVRSSWAQPFTGGVFGLQGFADAFYALNPFTPDRQYGIGRMTVSGRSLWVLVVGWTLVLITTLLIARLMSSPWGRVLKALREDEDAATALGKNVFFYKLQALMLGGALGALSGIVLAIDQQSVHPDAFQPRVTFILFVMVILGGAGTVWGPVVGAALFNFLYFAIDDLMVELQANVGFINSLLTEAEAALVKLVLVGIALMLLMIFRPQGLFGSREESLLSAR